ncbi:MAG TPA: hypothetical protein VGG41_06430 [Solirubrobacteraceae bacterium]
MRRVALLAVSIALVTCAASAAQTGNLDQMPLPRSELGPGTAALTLAPGSGVVSNAYAAHDAGHGYTAADLTRLGRITGYELDYVLPNASVPQTQRRLLGVQTIAELYRDRATAQGGLTFWSGVTRRLSGHQANGDSVAVAAFQAHVGDGSFAYELTYRQRGQTLYDVGDIVFRSGSLLGAVFVSATDAAGLRTRTLQLAHNLVSRMKRVQARQAAARD